MTPDQALFEKHIKSPRFLIGHDKGWWGIDNVSWPLVIFWISAQKKTGCPEKYYFKFDLNNYPAQAPTACPWDLTNKCNLDPGSWPKGKDLVNKVFNPNWNKGALYAPCDRIAMVNHDQQWKTDHPDLWWSSNSEITMYLEFIHKLLFSSDYEEQTT